MPRTTKKGRQVGRLKVRVPGRPRSEQEEFDSWKSKERERDTRLLYMRYWAYLGRLSVCGYEHHSSSPAAPMLIHHPCTMFTVLEQYSRPKQFVQCIRPIVSQPSVPTFVAHVLRLIFRAATSWASPLELWQPRSLTGTDRKRDGELHRLKNQQSILEGLEPGQSTD